MPKRYAREFRRAVCVRLVAGEKVSSLSPELGVSERSENWQSVSLERMSSASFLKASAKPFSSNETGDKPCEMTRTW